MNKTLIAATIVAFFILITKYIVVCWMRRNKTEDDKKKVRQPVVDGVTGADPVANARVYLELYDRKARTAKRWSDLLQIVNITAPLLATVLEGVVPSLAIRAIAGTATLAGGLMATKKFSEIWRSLRQGAHDLSFLIMEFEQGLITVDEFRKRFMEIIKAEAGRFQIVAAQTKSSDGK